MEVNTLTDSPHNKTAEWTHGEQARKALAHLFDMPIENALAFSHQRVKADGGFGPPTRQILQYRINRELTEAISELSKETKESGEKIGRLTRAYVNATWAIAIFTLLLGVIAGIQVWLSLIR